MLLEQPERDTGHPFTRAALWSPLALDPDLLTGTHLGLSELSGSITTPASVGFLDA